MEKYKLQITLSSSISTPLQSDTIWGHICWAIRYLKDESILKDFIRSYSKNEPPFIISNAFPEGYLPFPVLPPLDKKAIKNLIKKYWGENKLVCGNSGLKRLFQSRYLSKAVFKDLNDDILSKEKMADHFLESPKYCPRIADYLPEPCNKKYADTGRINCGMLTLKPGECPYEFENEFSKNREEREVIQHVMINRLSGTALDKALYTSEDTFPGYNTMDAYCMVDGAFTKDDLKQCLDYINVSGFGKDKSTGKGAVHCTITEGDLPAPANDIDSFMTLSSYVPMQNEHTQGNYKVFTKYGKLGGHYANSPVIPGKPPLPYKYPLIMFEAGSVFRTDNPREYYGRIIEKIHPADNPKIAHYGCAYPFFIRTGWE